MADVEHNTLHATANQHAIHRWAPANQAARFALSVVSGDRGKVAWQTSDNTFWILKDHTNVGNSNGWSATIGAQGDPGDDGAPGATGPAGPTGATGSQGVPGSGVVAVFNWGAVAAPANTGGRYFQRTFGAVAATFTSGEFTIPVAGTRTVTLAWSVATALVTDSITLTVYINGVATALTATMAAGALSGSASASLTVAVGDRIVVRCLQSSTEANATTWNAAVQVTIG